VLIKIFERRSRPPLCGQDGNIPLPARERGSWALAGALFVLGVAGLVAVLTGTIGRSATQAVAVPPAVLVTARTPVVAAGEQESFERQHEVADSQGSATRPAIVATPSTAQQIHDRPLFEDSPSTHISKAWMAGFYPIYAVAQQTFGVNWLLLASIHKQESAFSTAPSTYHGLNFANCCGGPMQFNVTNGGAGTPSTWDLVADSYIYGKRPAYYDHRTAKHPSIYDDFDAIMAGAHLLSVDGAGYGLEGGAWDAAYDYYGHDATGVSYADQVLARAIGWSQHGFCINCGSEQAILEAVHGAYGAPVLAALEAEASTATAARAKRHGRRRSR
jgi:hypothetical protein